MSTKFCPFKFSSFLAPIQPKSGIIDPKTQNLQFQQANTLCPCIFKECVAWSERQEKCLLIPTEISEPHEVKQ